MRLENENWEVEYIGFEYISDDEMKITERGIII